MLSFFFCCVLILLAHSRLLVRSRSLSSLSLSLTLFLYCFCITLGFRFFFLLRDFFFIFILFLLFSISSTVLSNVVVVVPNDCILIKSPECVIVTWVRDTQVYYQICIYMTWMCNTVCSRFLVYCFFAFISSIFFLYCLTCCKYMYSLYRRLLFETCQWFGRCIVLVSVCAYLFSPKKSFMFATIISW